VILRIYHLEIGERQVWTALRRRGPFNWFVECLRNLRTRASNLGIYEQECEWL